MKTPYRFKPFEPGIIVEVYLPKRANYQGTLYETLTSAFTWKNVLSHFEDSNRRPVIDELLKEYTEFYSPDMLETIDQFFWGYSVYEVDGVFFEKPHRNERGQIDEERTQVIRFMFFPDLALAETLITESDIASFGSVARAVSALLSKGRDERAIIGRNVPKLKDYIDRWVGAVGLFIFGYFIFNLTERIRALNLSDFHDLEKEIWVTSLWSLEVNKVSIEK
jgi:hypothetical protein